MYFQDPLYAAFWSRVQNNPADTVFKDFADGLSLIENGKNAMFISTGLLHGYFKSNPFVSQKIKVFGEGKPQYYGYLLPTNSPLKPVLQKGTNILIETGGMDHLMNYWLGTGVPLNKDSEKMVLSAGQVFLVFGIMLLTIGTVCCILLCEVFKKRVIDWKEKPFMMK